MKKIITYSLLALLAVSGRAESSNPPIVSGSWINTNIADYYKPGQKSACDLYELGKDRFIPIGLSFPSAKTANITYRIEQPIFTYKVSRLNSDSMSLSRGKSVLILSLENNILELRWPGHLVTFKKVSDSYSLYVFDEFVKDLIFATHENYVVSSFKENSRYRQLKLSRQTFLSKLKQLFGCQVEVLQLGTFKFGSSCLPEVGLYYKNEDKWKNPRALAILMGNRIIFKDSKGADVLILKPD